MDEPPLTHVELDAAGDAALSAPQAAALLGVTLEAFLADLRAGRVYSLVERGEGADAGTLRLSLRHRAKERRLIIDAESGRIIEFL
jgi:hypothetical protein